MRVPKNKRGMQSDPMLVKIGRTDCMTMHILQYVIAATDAATDAAILGANFGQE